MPEDLTCAWQKKRGKVNLRGDRGVSCPQLGVNMFWIKFHTRFSGGYLDKTTISSIIMELSIMRRIAAKEVTYHEDH